MSKKQEIELRIRIWNERWEAFRKRTNPYERDFITNVLDGLCGLFYWRTIQDLEEELWKLTS